MRVDQINQVDLITQTILEHLETAELVIADLTGHNPNVFFEIGYRSSTKKPIIHIKQKDEAIPFDIAAIRAFDYDLRDLDSVDAVKVRLEQTINGFDFTIYDEYGKNENLVSNSSQIVPLIFGLHDKIDELIYDMEKRYDETIQTVIRASIANAQQTETMETQMMKVLLPELLRNPRAVDSLMALSEKFKKE